MIQNQAELEHKLKQIGELQAELAKRRDHFNDSPDAIAFSSSYETMLNELMQDVQEYTGTNQPDAVYQFHFDTGKAGTLNKRVRIIQKFFDELQKIVWFSAERVLELSPRTSGSPERLVKENCTLEVAYAQPGSLRLGFNYVVEDMFPNEELQDSAASLLATATEIAAAEDFTGAQESGLDPQFLCHLAALGKASNDISSETRSKYRGKPAQLCLSNKMVLGAERLASRYKLSEPFEDSVHVGKLNFYTGKYEVTVQGQAVPLFYEKDVFSTELAEQVANKMLHVKGTLYKDQLGRIERLVVFSADLADK